MIVHLGHVGEDSLAPTVFALVRAGVQRRPDLAAELEAVVVLRFHEPYPPVALAFHVDHVVVGDADPTVHAEPDLEIRGRMGDVNALLAAPLAAGLPKPTHARGRRALARLADGRVELAGPIALGRKVLRLLTVEDALNTGRPRADHQR